MKHFILASLFSFSALAFLAGCGDEAKTVEYYNQHMEEAEQRVAECKKMEKMNETQQIDCANANQAILFKRDKSDKFYQSNPDAFKWKKSE